MPKKNTVEKNNKPVFGLFLDDGAYYSQSSLVNGVAEYLMNHGANLMTIPGNLNRHPGDEIFYSVNKMIPHLGPEDINGLIIATLKSRSVSLKQFHAQFGKYLPHPVVTIGYNVNSVPGILYNNESGVMELMRHLVETHRFRHFGFVRGPVDNYDSESRYKTYLDCIDMFGLPTDPRRVVSTNGTRESGKQAVSELLSKRLVSYDAIITASDELAIGVIDELAQCGFRVPHDIAVVGFGDNAESGTLTPSLTTVRHPLFRIGMQAAEMLMNPQNGKTSAQRVSIPATLVVRQSCGCYSTLSPVLQMSRKKTARLSPATIQSYAAIANDITLAMTAECATMASQHLLAKIANQLCKAFFINVRRKLFPVFIPVLSDAIKLTMDNNVDIAVFPAALRVLQSHAEAMLSKAHLPSSDILLRQAYIAVAEAECRFAGALRLRDLALLLKLHQLVKILTATFDLHRLLENIAVGMHDLGIGRGYLVICGEHGASLIDTLLYSNHDPSKHSVLVLSFDKSKKTIFDEDGLPFANSRLLPQMQTKRNAPFLQIIYSLISNDEFLGYLVFEPANTQLMLFELLAEQIANALNASILVKTVHDQTNDIAIAYRQREWEINQRKNVEKELVAAKTAAENANKSKSMFLANMSHELRTPLNSIVGFSEMLAEDAAEKHDPHFVSDLEKIRKAATHLRAIVNDILDLSKIEAGKMTTYVEHFSVELVVAEAIETMKPQIAASGLSLSVVVSPNTGTLYSDLTKVRQIILNLLSNAIKFTKEGTVSLHADRFTEKENDRVRFLVKDTGIGMTKEQAAHVFETYTQADPKTTSLYGGTGLGLAISQRLSVLLGGCITVTSEIGKGSEFIVTLPAHHSNPSQGAAS